MKSPLSLNKRIKVEVPDADQKLVQLCTGFCYAVVFLVVGELIGSPTERFVLILWYFAIK